MRYAQESLQAEHIVPQRARGGYGGLYTLIRGIEIARDVMTHGDAPEQCRRVLGDDRAIRCTLQSCTDVGWHGLLARAIQEYTEGNRGLRARVDILEVVELVECARGHLPRCCVEACLRQRNGDAGPSYGALVGRLDARREGACRVGILAGDLACARCEESAPFSVIDQCVHDHARLDRGERVDARCLYAIDHGQLPLQNGISAYHAHDGHLPHSG